MTFVPLKLTNENRSSFWVWGRSRIESLACVESKNRITGLNGAAHCHSLPHILPCVLLPGLLYFPRLPSKSSYLSPVTWVTLKSPKWSSVFPSILTPPAHHPWNVLFQAPGNYGSIQHPIACGPNAKVFSLIVLCISLSLVFCPQLPYTCQG